MTYPSTHYNSLEAIIAEFLAAVKLPAASACFAIAGPIVAGRAQVTNLTWVVDSDNLKSTFMWPEVKLLNDLESVAYAISILGPSDIHTISPGVRIEGRNIAVVAPGTGLGEAFLTYHNGRYQAHASEGSHVSFGPVGPLQIGLLQYMNQQGHEHVSYERVCSGGLGIPNLYAYLKSIGHAEEPAWLAEKLAGAEDLTPIIVNAAQDSTRPCELAVATAGNLALKVLTTGGIYLGGGISPRILADLESPEFLQALRGKGRFREMLTKYPVHVILNPKAGLLGAAAFGLSPS
jgi:glucokinase